MSFVVLKPTLLTFKNGILKEPSGRMRTVIVSVLLFLVMFGVYFLLTSFLESIIEKEDLRIVIPQQLLHLSLFIFFMLLLFSSAIAALGYFYSSQDLALLLRAPISPFTLYFSRLLQTAGNSSWLLCIFGIPAVLAFINALALPWTFALSALLMFLPFCLIPAVFGFLITTAFVNFVPPQRLRELFTGIALLAIFLFIIFVQTNNPFPGLVTSQPPGTDPITLLPADQSLALTRLSLLHDPTPTWLPSTWISNIMAWQINPQQPFPYLMAMATSLLMLVVIFVGYAVFQLCFHRGYTLSLEGIRRIHATRLSLLELVSRTLLPRSPQFRALLTKDARMLIRDPAQGIQLVLLLTLTLIYVYNFRALRDAPTDDGALFAWWQAILAVANILLSGSVLSAIATRFVFPSVSLEGRSYWILRSAPLSINSLLYKKFLAWLLFVFTISFILFLSGALAIEVPIHGILASGLLALALSIGMVGLSIGIGALYGSFDWETSAQVTASFGSLVYMLFSLGLVLATAVPASILLFSTVLNGTAFHMTVLEYSIITLSSGGIVLLVNILAARWGLQAGAAALAAREN